MADENEEAAALAVLLEANGYSSSWDAADGGSSRPSEITTLEMFLQDYPKMLALSHFGALTELRLIDQRIERIEGLQGCPNLKKLWLVENRISVIENLHPCTGLQELYLTSNKITDIAGLDSLVSLEVLWLADNYISSIQGVSRLTNLQQLDLARNDIALIGSSLQQSSGLTSLNLADNQISSLQDAVSALSSLSRLQALCLADPFWGACPVASLSNYQTCVLAQLLQLTSLDTLVLAQETKAAAAATLAKKQLYYSMRTTTLRRAMRDLCRHAQAAQQAQAQQWLETYGKLAHATKCLEFSAESVTEEQRQQQQALQHCMHAVSQHLASEQLRLLQGCQTARTAMQTAQSRLQLELSSAGNIWLEEGGPGADSMQSCQELVRSSSRDPSAGRAPHQGSSSYQVLAATRIHNRHLRAQFARHMDADDAFEYLFFCNPAADLMCIAQHGLSPLHNNWDPSAAIPLATHLTTSSMSAHPDSSDTMQGVVCRACLKGPCKRLPDAETIHDAAAPPALISTQQYPGLQAVYYASTASSSDHAHNLQQSSSRCRVTGSSSPQHRLWYVFDHTALLPEFIITCQRTDASTTEAHAQSSGIPECVASSSCKDTLLRLCAQPLDNWLRWDGQQPCQSGGGQALQARCAAVLATSTPPPCLRLPHLTQLGLTVATGGKQLDSLTRLSLQDCGCRSFVGLLGYLPSLVVLALPFNKLSSLEGLAQAAPGNKLAELDVSHNNISAWSGTWLQDCTALTALDASCNHSTQPADLRPLVRSAPGLRQLDLWFNPVQQHKAYRVALAELTSLSSLDGAAMQQQERQAPGSSCLTTALLHDKAALWQSSAGPVPTLPTLGAGDWRQLHSVVLEGRGLRVLHGLGAAHNLVSVNLADNLISDLSELSGCSRLQQLDVSNNLVLELLPLAEAVKLRQLDVSCNQISSLAPLSGLTALTQLCCESNPIASMARLSSLDSLVELYAAHNSLADVKEVQLLSVLSRLVVLDLVGNPLMAAASDDHRLWLLYKLGGLKVLNGIAADAAELAASQAQHAGRLTLGMLDEHLGSSSSLSGLRQLDLTAVGIKDLSTVFAAAGPLAALTSLTLDSNHLTSLSSLAGLTCLVALSVNSNRPFGGSQASWTFAAPAQDDQGQKVACSSPGAAKSLLPSLQTLQLAACGLTSLVPLQLQHLPALRSLFVQANELSRLDGLEGLVHLRELVADKNLIRVLEPEMFSSLRKLQELRLDDNAVRAIYPAMGVNGGLQACFPQLRVLQLSNNRLLDPSECANRLGAIPLLAEVAVSGNPFIRKHQAYRQLFIAQCSQLQLLDGQPVTAEEREYVDALATEADSPRYVEVPQYTAATLLAAATAAAAETRAAPPALPLARLQPHSNAQELPSPKLYGGPELPTVGTALSYEGLANLTAARQALLGGSGLPGLPPTSVPSIQSGVLVLTGPASFGLEGTAMRGSSPAMTGSQSGGASPSKASPGRSRQAADSPVGKVTQGSQRRTTTGNIASSRAGGFVVRQSTFQY